MLKMILLALLLSSGSAVAASFWGRRGEEALPLTMMAAMLALFAFGLAGALTAGYWAVLAALALGWPLAAAHAIRRRDLRDGYDYVMVMKMDGDFPDEYKALFVKGADVRAGRLYRVDRGAAVRLVADK